VVAAKGSLQLPETTTNGRFRQVVAARCRCCIFLVFGRSDTALETQYIEEGDVFTVVVASVGDSGVSIAELVSNQI